MNDRDRLRERSAEFLMRLVKPDLSLPMIGDAVMGVSPPSGALPWTRRDITCSEADGVRGTPTSW